MNFPLSAVSARQASVARWYRRYALALDADPRPDQWGRRGAGVVTMSESGRCTWCGVGQVSVAGAYCTTRCRLCLQARSWRVIRRMVLLRDLLRCTECGATAELAKGRGLEVDHVLAIADGGDDRPSNLVTRCKVQHWRKSAAEAKARRERWEVVPREAVTPNRETILPRGTDT